MLDQLQALLTHGAVAPHEVEAEMVRMAFRRYVAGDSYNRIAAKKYLSGSGLYFS